MAETTPKPKPTRAKRRNYEQELRSVRTYVETKLEVLRENITTDDLTTGQIRALEGVLKRLEAK